MADVHPPVEQYLETILELEESGIVPLRARLVERLGVSAPAVSETVARLEREGYLALDGERVIRLSDSGRSFGTTIMRRHRLAERLLTDVLGVPWSDVHVEACRLEHAISGTLEEVLVAKLGDPGTCPHGNPIPGSRNSVDHGPLVPLTALGTGAVAVVRRIDEALEVQTDRMRELQAAGCMPGATVTVSTADGGMIVTGETGATVTLTGRLAALVFVSDAVLAAA